MNELKAKCEQIEKRAAELRQVEEKKHSEELQFLKRTNTQLKVGFCFKPNSRSRVIFLVSGYGHAIRSNFSWTERASRSGGNSVIRG